MRGAWLRPCPIGSDETEWVFIATRPCPPVFLLSIQEASVMKVTCPSCSRRVRIKPNRENLCRCGEILDPFPAMDFKGKFASYRCNSVGEVTRRFLDNYQTEGEEIVSFLEDCVKMDDTRIMALLSAVEIIRSVKGTDHCVFARRMVERWPLNHKMRYMLSNCLALGDDRSKHIESLKQRIIGIHLEYGYMRGRGEREEKINELRRRFHQTIDWGRKFLSGEERYPNIRIERMARSLVGSNEGLEKLVEGLMRIADVSDLPRIRDRNTDIICVVDTNAISNPEASKYFSLQNIRFIAPEEVLLEISRWGHVEWTPLELDNIEIIEVGDRIPREIDTMFSKSKGKEPSLADKKIATLALNTRANAIISADKDLSDSGLAFSLEKNYGLHLDVVSPSGFHRWIERIKA